MADLFPSATIPALSLWQPYASLLFTAPPRKLHETRSWAYPAKLHGQDVLIHAALKRVPDSQLPEPLRWICRNEWGDDWRAALPYGKAVGRIRLGGCFSTDHLKAPTHDDWVSGDWSPGRYAWMAEAPRLLTQPLAMKGRQGWWSVPIEDLPA